LTAAPLAADDVLRLVEAAGEELPGPTLTARGAPAAAAAPPPPPEPRPTARPAVGDEDVTIPLRRAPAPGERAGMRMRGIATAQGARSLPATTCRSVCASLATSPVLSQAWVPALCCQARLPAEPASKAGVHGNRAGRAAGACFCALPCVSLP